MSKFKRDTTDQLSHNDPSALEDNEEPMFLQNLRHDNASKSHYISRAPIATGDRHMTFHRGGLGAEE